MARTHQAYPPEFRRQMVELVQSGRTPNELAREYEASAGSIRRVAQSERDAGQRSDGLSTDELLELRRLRRENKQLRTERDILKRGLQEFVWKDVTCGPAGRDCRRRKRRAGSGSGRCPAAGRRGGVDDDLRRGEVHGS